MMKTILKTWVVLQILFIHSLVAAQSVPVQIIELTNFSKSERVKIHAAAAALEKILSSDAFEKAVLDFTWNGEKHFADNEGLSNEDVYARIIKQVIEFDLELYNPPFWNRKGTVGYTNPGTPRIWMNRYYFKRFTPVQIAGNLAHEWMHKIGFDHDFKRTRKRPYSVPYAVGDIVIEVVEAAIVTKSQLSCFR